MEVRKVLRKATAIAASASFIGATMLGAVAQDLSTYPAPFVKDGVFDAFIVVGANAQPADVIGSVDVGTSLQFALKKTTGASGGASEATIDQGVKIQKSGEKFNYGDSVNSVLDDTALTQDDLPTTLADSKFVESEGDNKNSETYTQELRFNDAATATLVYDQDDDLAPKAADYVKVTKNDQLYNFTLEFDSEIEYNNESSTTAEDDLKTAVLTIQGKTYTITGVETTSAGAINKLTLLSGEAVLWLTQNNPITKTVNGVEHTVEVLDVTEAATEDEQACQVQVDDQRVIIDQDETKVVNGVQIGVTDVRAIHAQLQDTDVCQISIGASEVVLENGQEIKVDDVDQDGSRASIDSDGDGVWNGFTVTLQPKEMDDDVYLAKGKSFVDPIFGSWALVYGGLTADYETYSVKTSGDDDAEFTFINNDGKEVEIPIRRNESGGVFLGTGDDVDERLYSAGANISIVQSTCTGAASAEDCEGMLILAATNGAEAHVFEVSDIDLDKNETDIKDVTYGRTFNDVDFTQAGAGTALDLGSFGTNLILNISAGPKTVVVVGAVPVRIETKAGGSLDIATFASLNNATVTLDEKNGAGEDDIADEKTASTIAINVKPNTDDELEARAGTWTNQVASVDLEEDSDYTVKVSQVGSIATADSENQDSVVVQMPKGEVYGNVFVAPVGAQVSTAEGGIPAYTLTKLNVGAAKLDSEISDVGANNLITVGGPCANRVTAQVLGLTYPACGAASGIAAGTAIIQEVVQSSGKVALVVAGYEADDSRRAARVLSNYDQYALSGSKVVVTGTSLTDIKVSKSA